MKRIMKTFSLFIAIFLVIQAQAQTGPDTLNVLRLEEAVDIAINRNFDVQLARNQLRIAENNNAFGNAGFLPQINLNGGYDYSSDATKTVFANPELPDIEASGAVTQVMNANAVLSYNIFSGGRRSNTLRLLENDQYISELELRASIEFTILNVMDQYFNAVARLEEVNLTQESVDISQDRYQRAREGYNFGSFSKVELLNAEVDLRNDSTSLIDARLRYQNALRNLNNVMGIDPDSVFQVADIIDYNQNLNLGQLIDEALLRNSNYLISRADITASELNIELAKANFFPSLDLGGGYAYNNAEYDANFINSSRNNGWNAGVTLSYNIFDGGNIRREARNARILNESSQIQLEKTENQLKTDLLINYNNYETNKELLALNIRNLELAEANYERSQEAFTTGEITGLQLREAQLNLLSARFNVIQLRIQTKVSEVNLYYLSGTLVEPIESNPLD
jgi:outer membrane protein TolC